MRLWPFRRPNAAVAAPADSSGFTVAQLPPPPPPPAVTQLLARFRPFGYTPFLQAGQGLTWVRALPFVDVEVPSRPRTNIILFLLSVVSTLVAGGGGGFA